MCTRNCLWGARLRVASRFRLRLGCQARIEAKGQRLADARPGKILMDWIQQKSVFPRD